MLPCIEVEEALSSTAGAAAMTTNAVPTHADAVTRFVPMKTLIAASIVTAVVGGVLLANSSFSVSAPRVVVLVGEATVSPFAMMMNAPLSLPMQQYDSYRLSR
jgi:hypothetical protein